ncbi:hypothetical protein DGI_1631 [Megalodesulfovibrio gigas DSM 1382 = ATCC 19364]|uniref:Peptidase M15C domain-containing protein n=2 Tax=Megalodesulfovibrio gigas TaxID=879 RepID=T2GBA5_MEGG1|nr:hypothetical protein DGI_1631 [Megalodesulfovibrio gigas DSM 1382 = ATCC 19364]
MHRVQWLFCGVVVALGMVCGAAAVMADSNLTSGQAIFMNQPPDVLPEVQAQQVLVSVPYHGFDGAVHQGQVVIHKALAEDVAAAFAVMFTHRFPLDSVLPIAHPTILAKGPYGLSSETNNTSGYVWRPVVGAQQLSMHALGLAVDINPHLNPYIKGKLILPPGATYAPAAPGTLTPESPVVQAFKRLGWTWGGDWNKAEKVDYMHFQKIPPGWEDWVRQHRD